jgi:hypothetical protein
MEKNIPEIEARDILMGYEGFNNQLLEWKQKFTTKNNFKLTRTQAEYVLKYHSVTPKVARKHINLVPSFGEKIEKIDYYQKFLKKFGVRNYCVKVKKRIIFLVKF